MNINDMQPDESAYITSLAELDPKTAKKLRDLGMTMGQQIKFIQRAPLGDPVSVSYTHLDVYKRQVIDSAYLKLFRDFQRLPQGNPANAAKTVNPNFYSHDYLLPKSYLF